MIEFRHDRPTAPCEIHRPERSRGRSDLPQFQYRRRGQRPLACQLRFDFAIDEGAGRITRVQCKSGVYRHGCVYFRTASADRRRPNGDPYIGQIDAFAVYCPELDASFLVPIEHISARHVAALRIDRPISREMAEIRWAKPYLLSGSLPQRESLSSVERKTGFEPATPILARLCATTAPLPLAEYRGSYQALPAKAKAAAITARGYTGAARPVCWSRAPTSATPRPKGWQSG